MPQTANVLLKQILEYIDFEGDKEAFANDFLQTVEKQAILDLIESLPKAKQDELKQILSQNLQKSEGVSAVLKGYFPEQQITKALENAAKNGVSEYIQAILPTLNEEQKTKLTELAKNLQTANQTTTS